MHNPVGSHAVSASRSGDIVDIKIGERGRDPLPGLIEHRMMEQGNMDAVHLRRSKSGRRTCVKAPERSVAQASILA